MKKTLEFVDAMTNTSIPSPFMIAQESGRLDATEAGYLANLVAELAAVQAACKLAGEKLTREELDEIAKLLRWEEPFLFFIRAAFSELGMFDGEFDFASELDEAQRELLEAFPLPEADG